MSYSPPFLVKVETARKEAIEGDHQLSLVVELAAVRESILSLKEMKGVEGLDPTNTWTGISAEGQGRDQPGWLILILYL